jgi:hypothetical protein
MTSQAVAHSLIASALRLIIQRTLVVVLASLLRLAAVEWAATVAIRRAAVDKGSSGNSVEGTRS